MNKKIEKYMKKFVRYILRTYKNKLASLLMFAIGIVSAKISNDATFLVFVVMLFGPIFFINENCFY